MGNNTNKNSRIKILKPHAHLPVTGRKSIKFQMNAMKDVGGVAETRSWLAEFKDYLPYLFHGFRNKNVNNFSLGNMLYFHN